MNDVAVEFSDFMWFPKAESEGHVPGATTYCELGDVFGRIMSLFKSCFSYVFG